jgi:hypothetical protein
MGPRWVVNASPLILLGKVNHLHLFELIPEVRTVLDALEEAGMRLSGDVKTRALHMAGER